MLINIVHKWKWVYTEANDGKEKPSVLIELVIRLARRITVPLARSRHFS